MEVWKKEIEELSTPKSKLLCLVNLLKKENEISDEDKKKLKLYIFQDNQSLLNALNDLQKTNDFQSFISTIKSLISDFCEKKESQPESILFKALMSFVKMNSYKRNNKLISSNKVEKKENNFNGYSDTMSRKNKKRL